MRRRVHCVALPAALWLAVGLLFTTSASAGGPIKWVLSSHVGRGVDSTLAEHGAPQEERNECTVLSGDTCQLGVEGTGPREFNYSKSVAVSALTGDVYIADRGNHRIQVLDPEGRFVSMFGWNVDKTKLALGSGSTQAEKDVCTAESHDECGQAERGTGGAATGLGAQLWEPEAIATDPASGHVYVFDEGYVRVDEYSASGEFLVAIGGHVNKKGGNVCTASEECQSAVNGPGPGEFSTAVPSGGDRITVGPEDHLLYVGDAGRVEKFNASGAAEGEVSAKGLSGTGLVTNVAVDASGNLFVTDGETSGVEELTPNGAAGPCVIDSGGNELERVSGIAFDAYGRLGVLGFKVKEEVEGAKAILYKTGGSECGKTVGGAIVPPSGEMGKGTYEKRPGFEAKPIGLAFSSHKKSASLPGEDQLYVADSNGFFNEVEGYRAVLFPEVRTCPTSKVSFTSASLCGEINPQTIPAGGFFKYGTDPGKLELLTVPLVSLGSGEAFAPFGSEVTGLVPNQLYWDEAWVQAEAEGKPATAGTPPPVSFHTNTPPPELPEPPEVVAVGETSATLKAAVNPEHAAAHYHFEYAPCAAEAEPFAECAPAQATGDLESARYGVLGIAQEISGLEPATSYAYRFHADNHFAYEGKPEGGVTIQEGHFATRPLPVPAAETGSASEVTATTALIAGTVTPAGQPAAYAFELGVWEGAGTQFGIVLSRSAGSSIGPVAEQLALSSLQPGTTYAFRIKVQSGYGQATGAAATFTTAGTPLLLAAPGAPAELPVPGIAFPKEPSGGKPSPKSTKLALALKACPKRPKSRRARCERAARKKYGPKGSRSKPQRKRRK